MRARVAPALTLSPSFTSVVSRPPRLARNPRKARIRTHVGVASVDQREEAMGEALGDVARGIARERGPRVDGGLVEGRLEIEPDGHAVIGLEGERVLHGDADEPSRHPGGIERGEQPADDGHAIGLVAVDGRAQVKGRSGSGAVEQGEGQTHPHAVGKLDQLEAVTDHPARGNSNARDAPRLAHRRPPGTSMSRTAPAWTRATSSRSAVSMDSSGPPMLWTAGP